MHLKNKIQTALLILVTAVQPCFAVTFSNEMLLVAKKFIMAMIGVVIASVLIYLGLTIYNKFFHNPKTQEASTYDEKTLEDAKTLDNAISNFLNRTNL